MGNYFALLLRYFKANKITGSVILYIFFTAILKATTAVDIAIPCLWRKLFDFECPGCGLNTAFTHIIQLDFESAYQANKLAFVLLPAAMCYLYFDLLKFSKIETQ